MFLGLTSQRSEAPCSTTELVLVLAVQGLEFIALMVGSTFAAEVELELAALEVGLALAAAQVAALEKLGWPPPAAGDRSCEPGN